MLSTVDEQNSLILEEGEVQQSEVQDEELEANRGPLVSIPECIEPLSEDISMHVISPMRTTSSPSYAEALKKKKLVESSDSLEEDEHFTKKGGRKSSKEIIEEEAERLNMQGSQATIERSFGRSKRNRPPKGGATPSSIGK